MVTLVSSDNEEFHVTKEFAFNSKLLQDMIADIGETSEPIPLANISSATLRDIIEFYTKHMDSKPPPNLSNAELDEWKKTLEEWDIKFIERYPGDEELFTLILAVNFLDMKDLMDVCCHRVAREIKDLSTDEIRAKFDMPDDLTDAEKEQIILEQSWLLDEK